MEAGERIKCSALLPSPQISAGTKEKDASESPPLRVRTADEPLVRHLLGYHRALFRAELDGVSPWLQTAEPVCSRSVSAAPKGQSSDLALARLTAQKQTDSPKIISSRANWQNNHFLKD